MPSNKVLSKDKTMTYNCNLVLNIAAVIVLLLGLVPSTLDPAQTNEDSRRLEGLFHQLAADDESAAEALRLLSEENPTAVKKILEKRKFNVGFKIRFLRQLIPFVEYCRSHGIPYRPDAVWHEKLRRLFSELPFRERYRLENEFALQASLNDIPAMEYWAVIYSEDNRGFSASISRILNISYSRFWREIAHSPEQLRFYLKKSALFDNLGIVGLCNDYLKRFGRASKKTIDVLRGLQDAESDPQIRNQVSKALASINPSSSTSLSDNREGLSLDQFIGRLDSIDLESAGLVRLQETEDEYRRVFKKIQEEKRPEILAKWIRMIEANLSVTMTPFLMQIIEKKEGLEEGFSNFHDRSMRDHISTFTITVSDRVVNMLEYLFSHRFPLPPSPESDQVEFISETMSGNAYLRDKGKTAPKWLELWRAEGENYLRWEEKLYAQKLKNLQSLPTVSIDALMELLYSRFLKPEDRGVIWQAAAKVKPLKSIAGLEIKEGMISPAEWKYLPALRLEPETLAGIIQRTNVAPDQYGVLLSFLRQICSGYSSSEKDRLFLELCHWEPLRGALKEELDPIFLREIQDGLQEWIKEPLYGFDFYKEWADELRLYIEICRWPLDEQLHMLETYTGPGGEEAAIQLLDSLDYSGLGTVLKHFSRLPLPDFRKVRYIIEDFGICVENWSEDKLETKQIDELANRYQTLSEKELYAYYLDRLGIDYKKADGTLDYEKIRWILKFDSVFGFMGFGSNYPHVLTLIRLLELAFETRLGFPSHFNHYIKSMGEYTEGRVKKWITFLEEKKLVAPAVDDAPVF